MIYSDQLKREEFYKALVDKDSEYVGLFYVGVKTTSIFCISTCRARKPKFENTVFYDSFKDALDHGFRPCKICKPTQHTHSAPDFVEKALQMVRDTPYEKVKDYMLRNEGIQPERLRRWFKKHYNMTFQAYQRMIRINNAYNELRAGKSKSHSAYNSGYESLSGFAYSLKKLVGKGKIDFTNPPILINRLTTPLGPMFVCSTNSGICLLEFVDRRMLESEFQDLQKRLQSHISFGDNKHIKLLREELNLYFEGRLKNFSVSLDPQGTTFQQSVWKALLGIHIGQTRSYKELAMILNKPTAIRAVASANGYNKLAILVPCHRIIGHDGSLTGYGGGLERKAWLLRHEAKMSKA